MDVPTRLRLLAIQCAAPLLYGIAYGIGRLFTFDGQAAVLVLPLALLALPFAACCRAGGPA